MQNDFSPAGIEKQISQIMDNFDFKKVHEHMIATNHKWHMDIMDMRVPTIEEVKNQARSLLIKAGYDPQPATNVGTGGFMAFKMPWGLHLCFQLTSGGSF